MRRILTASVAFTALTASFLVLPVYAAPGPEAAPVSTSSDLIDLGSVAAPSAEAEVQEGLTDPVAGVADTLPTLTVTREDVAEFSLVGVTWAYDPGVVDTVVQVRVQDDAGSWGEWTEVGVETADQGLATATGAQLRSGTSPLWTGPSTGVDVELVTRTGAQPTDVQLDLVDPGESPADTALAGPAVGDTAHAAASMPPVYSRAQWGADESIRTWDPEYPAKIKAATLHHTADTNNYTADQVPAMMRSIYRYHTVSLGWGDIGYNVIVDKFGRLWEGRYGGLASTVTGAHAGGFNTGTFGVSMLGNYDTLPVPQVTVDAVAAVIAWKFSLFGVDPRGTTVLTSGGGGTARYAKGTAVTLPTVFGHLDVGSTACPGRYGYARLPEIRDRVAAAMGPAGTPAIVRGYASDVQLQSVLGAAVGPEGRDGDVVWQRYQGGSLYYSPATGVVLVRGGVLGAYLAAGGPASLGAPTLKERSLPDGRGVRADFQRGQIYWTATTGAHVVRGAIAARWYALGGERGELGYPVAGEKAVSGGAVSRFERGALYWSEGTGTQLVRGGVLGAYERAGGSSGPLLFPVGDETDAAGGRGRVQQFQSGAVYWSPTTGGRVVRGGIARGWASLGGVTGVLGFPASDEADTSGRPGRVQTFESGYVYWSAAAGGHPVRGGVLGAWTAAGGVGGPAGFPTSDETPTTQGGVVQTFESGSVLWLPATGAHLVRGGVGAAWQATGDVSGPLGHPVGGEQDVPGGAGRVQRFQGGSVYWTGDRAVVASGDIAAAHDAAGGPAGLLGLPVGPAVPTAGGAGRVQPFAGGSVYWSAPTRAHVVRGGIGGAWLATGGVTGPLGFPTGGETAVPGGVTQQFQNGSVDWSSTTRATTVRYR